MNEDKLDSYKPIEKFVLLLKHHYNLNFLKHIIHTFLEVLVSLVYKGTVKSILK